MIKQFWAFVKKEILHILRDRRTLLILFGMPVAQVLIFGFAVTNEFKHASIAVMDYAKDPLSQEFIEHLEASGHFEVKEYLSDKDAIERAFQKASIKLAVVIPDNFSADFYGGKGVEVQLLADGSEPNYATSLLNYANIMISEFQQAKTPNNKNPYQLDVQIKMIYNPSLQSVYMFVPGVMAMILMLISAMMTALTLAKEKELGTMELLLVSPLPPLLILFGKVTPYVLLSFINAVIILLMGVYVFHVPIHGSLMLLLLSCGLFVLTSLALGIFISTKTDTQQTAMLVSLMVLMMPTVLLSGFIFPIDSMPFPLQMISKLLPAKYFIIILKNLMLKGTGMLFIWKELLVLLAMTFVFMMVGLKNFKIRLD